jgi:hypothetical protein
MKAYGGVDIEIHILLTSAIVGGEGSASPLYPQYALNKRLVGPQSRSGRLGEDKILYRTNNVS